MHRTVCLLLAVGCGDPSTDECARRICGTPGDAGSAPRDAGETPIDAAARPDAGPLLGIDGGAPPDGGSAPASCHDCTSWQTACDGSDRATRTCTPRPGCTAPAPETTRDLPRLDEDFFRCRVQPVLDRGCDQMACHGTDTGRPLRVYSRLSWRLPARFSGSDTRDSTAPLSSMEWCRNFDSARSFATSDPAASELVRQPLEPLAGGLAHTGIHLFADTADAEYRVLLDWLSGASLASCDPGFNGHP